MKIINLINKIRVKKWIKDGLIIGENTSIQRDVHIDASFPWLVQIGKNVTLAPEVLVLTHDGSTKKILDYSKVGKVKIEDNVFIGAKSIILPGTTIGENTIVGAGSVVSGIVPKNVVIAGNPAKIIMSAEDFITKHQKKLNECKKYDTSYTKKGRITTDKKEIMKKELNSRNGYVK